MRISRIYTDQPLVPDSELVLEQRKGHYLLRVLKLRSGDAFVLFNGDGFDYAAELRSVKRDAVTARINTRLPAVAESPLRLTLVQAVGKGDRMDYSLQKATELGVAQVQPVFTARTEVRLKGARLEKRMAHWRGVLVSACEQSGRATLPLLGDALSLEDWLAQPSDEARYVLDPRADRCLAASENPGESATVVIGPEGGFTEQETHVLALAGVEPVQLGPRVLRTETAGPAAITVLQSLFGDFAPDRD